MTKAFTVHMEMTGDASSLQAAMASSQQEIAKLVRENQRLMASTRGASLEMRAIGAVIGGLVRDLAAGRSTAHAFGLAVAGLSGAFGILGAVVGGIGVPLVASLFREVRDGSEDLERQSDLIRRVAKDWDDAVPSIKAYVEQMEQTSRVADLFEATGIREGQILAALRKEFAALEPEVLKSLANLGISALEGTAKVGAFQFAFQDLGVAIRDGSASAADFERAADALATLIDSHGTPALNAAAESLDGMKAALAGATGEMARLRSETEEAVYALQELRAATGGEITAYHEAASIGGSFIAEQERLNAMSREELALHREIERIQAGLRREGGIRTQAEVEDLARATLDANERRRREGRGGLTGGRGGGRASRTAGDEEGERILRGLRDEIDAIRELDPLQQEMIRWREQLRDLPPEQAAAVRGLVTELYDERAAIEDLIKRLDDMRDIGKGALDDLVTGIRDASSATEILGRVLDGVGEKLMNLGVEALGDHFFGKNGSKDTGVLGGALSGILGMILPFAQGGVVTGATLFAHAAGLGVMGEAGPEAIMPLKGGGVGASVGGQEMRLPLTRLATGDLGVAVQPFAQGGIVGGMAAPSALRLAGGQVGGASPASAERIQIEMGITLSPELKVDLLTTAGQEVDVKLRQAAREMDNQLPRRMRQISSDPAFMGRKR